MRTRLLLASLVLVAAVSAAVPALALASTSPWPQYQGNAARTGFAAEAPALPYGTAWSAPADIGDTTHISGVPAPALTDSLAIVVGREEVAAVDLAVGFGGLDGSARAGAVLTPGGGGRTGVVPRGRWR